MDTSTARELIAAAGTSTTRRPPRVNEPPLIGSAVAFLRDPVRYMLRCYREYGPVYRIRLGTDLYTVIGGLEGSNWMTREGRAYVSSEGVWSSPSRLMGADPRANMTNVDGERHTQLRNLALPGMSKNAAVSALEKSVRFAESKVRQALREARPIDAVDLAREMVFEQLGSSMAGAAPREMFGASYRVLTAIVRATRLPVLSHLPPNRSLRTAVAEVRALSADIVRRPPPHPPYLQAILRAVDEGVFSPRDLPMLMLTPFIAGLDTFANTMAFVLYRLARHPDWQARLRDEVDRALDARGSWDGEALQACPELGYFVQEVMRLHPLSPAMMRVAKQAFVIEGYQVDQGERLLFPHTMPHLMHEVYPDPERFDPLRFHPSRAEQRGPNRYAPYGIGPHVCLGAGTADVLLRTDAAILLRLTELRPARPDYELRVSNTSGARPVGFELRLAARVLPNAVRVSA